jgi:hypothetical protein
VLGALFTRFLEEFVMAARRPLRIVRRKAEGAVLFDV